MSELMQTISVDKLKKYCTYPSVLNYWAPLAHLLEDEEDKSSPKRKYMGSVQKTMTKEITIIIDSGASSHFATTKANLPETGQSNKERSEGSDHKNISAIAAARDTEWDVTKTLAVYFIHVEKSIKHLEQFNIKTNRALCMNKAMEVFDSCGLFDTAVSGIKKLTRRKHGQM